MPQAPHPGACPTAPLQAGGDSSLHPVRVEVQTPHRPLPVWVGVRHPGFSAVVGQNGAVIFKMFSVWLGSPFPGPLQTRWLWLSVLLSFLLADFSSSMSGIIKCTYTHTHLHPHPHACIHTIHTHTHTYIPPHSPTHICTHIYTHIHIHTTPHTHMYTHAHMHTHNTHRDTHPHTRIHIYIHTIHIYKHAYTHTYTHSHTYTHLYTHTHTQREELTKVFHALDSEVPRWSAYFFSAIQSLSLLF